MVNMIAGQRAYEANSKIIKTSDEMLQMANNVRHRLDILASLQLSEYRAFECVSG